MLKRMLAVGLPVVLAAGVCASCGGSSSKPSPGIGTLISFIEDAPLCDVLSFRVSITGLTLAPMGGGTSVTLISSSSLPVRVDFASLRDFSTILNLARVPAGAYSQATFTFGASQITVFDPTQSPPITNLTVKFATSTSTFKIEPALMVTPVTTTQTAVSALRMDFDLSRSIQLDSQGQVTADVTPVMTLSPAVASMSAGFGEIDDLLGFVQRVDTFSANTNFTGDFALQLLSGTGPSPIVNLTNATRLCGPAMSSDSPCVGVRLNELLTDSFADVDGFVDLNGNLVANSVELEDQENLSNNMLAFIGSVLSLTKDSHGNVTQFELFVREEEPDSGFSVPVDSVVVVKVSPSTVYQFSSRLTNFVSPNLPFDATALAAGQEVVVHGVFTVPPATTPPAPAPLTTVAADKVYLKLQTHQGAFSALLQVGPDDRTGAFTVVPCASLFGGTPIFVFTTSQTTFVNVSGLSALTPQPSLLVKGLLFFELQGTIINGVSVPPGSLVLLAKQVHQLT